MFSITEIIDIAVHLEKIGEAIYREAAESHPEPALVSRLRWLADEEALHAETFLAMKAAVKVEVDDPSLAKMARKLFQQAVGRQGFSLSDKELSKIEATHELVNLAMEFEQDTVIFYEMLRPFIQDETARKQLDHIIEEEHRHVRQLRSLVTAETL